MKAQEGAERVPRDWLRYHEWKRTKEGLGGGKKVPRKGKWCGTDAISEK